MCHVSIHSLDFIFNKYILSFLSIVPSLTYTLPIHTYSLNLPPLLLTVTTYFRFISSFSHSSFLRVSTETKLNAIKQKQNRHLFFWNECVLTPSFSHNFAHQSTRTTTPDHFDTTSGFFFFLGFRPSPHNSNKISCSHLLVSCVPPNQSFVGLTATLTLVTLIHSQFIYLHAYIHYSWTWPTRLITLFKYHILLRT